MRTLGISTQGRHFPPRFQGAARWPSLLREAVLPCTGRPHSVVVDACYWRKADIEALGLPGPPNEGRNDQICDCSAVSAIGFFTWVAALVRPAFILWQMTAR